MLNERLFAWLCHFLCACRSAVRKDLSATAASVASASRAEHSAARGEARVESPATERSGLVTAPESGRAKLQAQGHPKSPSKSNPLSPIRDTRHGKSFSPSPSPSPSKSMLQSRTGHATLPLARPRVSSGIERTAPNCLVSFSWGYRWRPGLHDGRLHTELFALFVRLFSCVFVVLPVVRSTEACHRWLRASQRRHRCV